MDVSGHDVVYAEGGCKVLLERIKDQLRTTQMMIYGNNVLVII
jgi:hypothetical protein